jgi:uncharacterized repeat protein (TIGR02543 family)
LLADGTVTCWGANLGGQSSVPAGVTSAIAISAGIYHSCALLDGGTVTCWGGDWEGQSSVPAGVTSATAISAGDSHSCALLSGGTVTCWGANWGGQTDVPAGVTSAIAISAGDSHSCALLADGTVTCWGYDVHGQSSVPAGVTSAIVISAGGEHSCALLADGTVTCWGRDDYGQSSVPAGVTTATAISAGRYHTCALLADGTVTCWGWNYYGQTSVPAGVTTASAISAGGYHSCALLEDGTVTCWGGDWEGQSSVPALTQDVLISSWPYTHGQSSDFTLFARWTANTLTVTTDEQDGTAIGNASTTTGASMLSPGTPTRAGYTFAGWYAAVSGGSAITFPYTHGQTGDFTLYAQWTANTLTVTTDEQGGTAIGNASTTTGASMSSPGTPTRAGYTFAGWYTAASAGTLVTFPYAHGRTTDFTLYAQWTANTLTVTTDEQDGTAIGDASTTTGASMSSPGTPTRAGYTFAGWYAAVSGGSAITFPYAHGHTSDFTLFARWTAKTLAVTYNSGGGSSVTATSTTTGASMLSPRTPTRAGYTFAGWYAAVSGGSAITFPYAHGHTSAFTLFARWTAKTLAVTYNSGGGSSVTATSTTTGASMLSPRTPTRSGYTFAGWYAAVSGGSAIRFPYAHGRTSAFTLFARWTR